MVQRIHSFLSTLSLVQQLFLLCFISFLVRLFFSFYSHGIWYIDEAHVFLDPAAHLSEGLSKHALGEMLFGRSAIPIYFISSLIQFCDFLRFSDPLHQIVVIRVFLSLWSLFGIVSIYHIVLLFYPSQKNTAFWTTLFVSLWGYHIYANLRTLGECLSIPLILWGLWLFQKSLFKTDQSFIHRFILILCGALLGLAVTFKLQSGLFLAGLGIYALIYRKFFHLFYLGVGFLIMFVLYGALDFVTHGAFLQSFVEYFQYNMSQGVTTGLAKSYHRFFTDLFVLHFPLLFPFVIYFVSKDFRRYQMILFSVGLYLIFHFFHPLKYIRNMAPVLPIFLMLFMASFLNWKPRRFVYRKIIFALIFAALIFQFLAVPFSKFFRPRWQESAPECLAQAWVGRQNDVTGLLLLHTRWPQLYFYLRQNIFVSREPEILNAHSEINYLIRRTKDKKGRPMDVSSHTKLVEDFKLNHPPLKTFGDYAIYRRDR